ncbi:hypothetical protein HZU77_016435 [Neisseriaceae bacterium TC5R-5]|nr:hypothetical protein [Neisseriaceae bacterium TC5R-5]
MAKTVKYDDVSWHTGGEFPEDLDAQAARTHIGFFIGWAIDNNFQSDLLNENFPEEIEKFKQRKISGSKIIEKCCDDKLTSDDLNDVGIKFANYYYDELYMDDYADLSDDDLATIYHEPDNYEKYKQVFDVIESRYRSWVESKN